jgi:hypothetical protein
MTDLMLMFNPDAPEQPTRIESLENDSCLRISQGANALISYVLENSKQSPPSLYDLKPCKEKQYKIRHDRFRHLNVITRILERKSCYLSKNRQQILSEIFFPQSKEIGNIAEDMKFIWIG